MAELTMVAMRADTTMMVSNLEIRKRKVETDFVK